MKKTEMKYLYELDMPMGSELNLLPQKFMALMALITLKKQRQNLKTLKLMRN